MQVLGYFPSIFEEAWLADATTTKRFSGAITDMADSILSITPAKTSTWHWHVTRVGFAVAFEMKLLGYFPSIFEEI